MAATEIFAACLQVFTVVHQAPVGGANGHQLLKLGQAHGHGTMRWLQSQCSKQSVQEPCIFAW